jgi:predicted nuclease of predicted toxin-antitoxin system
MEAGISDDTVLDLANKESSLLITADKDFGEMVFRKRLIMHGIVLIRLAGITPLHKAEIVSSTINKYKSQLQHAFSVITPGAIRIRQRS